MNRHICTATIFVAILATIWFGCTYQVSGYVWWYSGEMKIYAEKRTQSVLGWLIGNGFPVIGIALALYSTWSISAAICGVLRRRASERLPPLP